MNQLDPRLHAIRNGSELRHGAPRRVTRPIAGLHKEPRGDASLLTQALMGEDLTVFEERNGWAWVRLGRDGYVGHVAASALVPAGGVAQHQVRAPLTFIYPSPNIKSQPAPLLTMNARVEVVADDGRFASLAGGGFVVSQHLAPVGQGPSDFVAVAGSLLHAPYLWGGKSALGIDCSGLVQVSLHACGWPCPRDSDMQEDALGGPVPHDDLTALRRGDLVFWDGHVGIMATAAELIHANGHAMQVSREPLRAAVDRIAAMYGAITSVKRLGPQ